MSFEIHFRQCAQHFDAIVYVRDDNLEPSRWDALRVWVPRCNESVFSRPTVREIIFDYIDLIEIVDDNQPVVLRL